MPTRLFLATDYHDSSPVHEAQETREHRVRLHDRIPRLLTYRTLVMPPPLSLSLPSSSPNVSVRIALFGAKLRSFHDFPLNGSKVEEWSELKTIKERDFSYLSLSLSLLATSEVDESKIDESKGKTVLILFE